MFISTPFLSSSKLSLYITAWFYIPSILTMFNCTLFSRLLANSSQTGVIFWQCSHQGAEHLTSLSRMMRLISSKDSAVAGFSSGTFFIISINLELYTNIFLHHSWQTYVLIIQKHPGQSRAVVVIVELGDGDLTVHVVIGSLLGGGQPLAVPLHWGEEHHKVDASCWQVYS